jgi:hypothetical protein
MPPQAQHDRKLEDDADRNGTTAISLSAGDTVAGFVLGGRPPMHVAASFAEVLRELAHQDRPRSKSSADIWTRTAACSRYRKASIPPTGML